VVSTGKRDVSRGEGGCAAIVRKCFLGKIRKLSEGGGMYPGSWQCQSGRKDQQRPDRLERKTGGGRTVVF